MKERCFSVFRKLFKKKEKVTDIVLTAPISGKMLALENVPDPVFAKKMMGDGIAVDPVNGKVVSPIDGKIIQVFPTKHAVGISTNNGVEILIHIGLDTVNLNGEGFTSHVNEGDQVKQGELLISFEIDLVREKAKSAVTPIIITNTEDIAEISINDKDNVTAGLDEIMIVKNNTQ